MKYIKILIILVLLMSLIIFGVNNTRTFELSFLGYCIAKPLALWSLLTIFFFAGMLTIFLIGLPDKISNRMQIKALEKKISEIETSLESNEQTKSSSDSR